SKYQHRFCNTEYGTLKLDEQELAVTCELLLRGPQTPGELRSRASRMATFADVTDVEATLTRLSEREGGPFVTRLAREPGRRESRFAHLFGGPVSGAVSGAGHVGGESGAAASGSGSGPGQASGPAADLVGTGGGSSPSLRPSGSPPEVIFPASMNDERLAKLEADVEQLRAEVAELKMRLTTYK